MERFVTHCRRFVLIAGVVSITASTSSTVAAQAPNAKPAGQAPPAAKSNGDPGSQPSNEFSFGPGFVVSSPLQNGPFQPDQFFERMFGPTTPAEKAQLEKIEISAAEEREFGNRITSAFIDDLRRQKIRLLQAGRDVKYLQALVETLQPHMTHGKRYPKIRVYYVDSPKVDARAMPGGELFFFRGLLEAAESEAALVGIVGHELSHLDRGHLLLPLRRQKLMSGEAKLDGAVKKPGKGSSPKQAVAASDLFAGVSAMRLLARPFHPEDEAEADSDGAAWAYAAGYDPRETARLWERLARKSSDPNFPFSDFFRTHPHSDDRAASLMRQHDALQAAQPRADLYRGRKNLADRVAKSQQTFPE